MAVAIGRVDPVKTRPIFQVGVNCTLMKSMGTGYLTNCSRRFNFCK